MKMTLPNCPNCHTDAYVVPEAWGEEVGTVLGGSVGIGLAISRGARAGSTIGTQVTESLPAPFHYLGSAGGAVVGGLAGAISIILACSALGRQIGFEVDEHLIKAYRCNCCNTIIRA